MRPRAQAVVLSDAHPVGGDPEYLEVHGDPPGAAPGLRDLARHRGQRLPFYFWDKTRQERLIAASGVEWVIVRPGVLTNGARRGAPRHGLRVGNFLWTVRIPRAAVADFMLQQLTSDTCLRTAPGVCR